MNNKDINWVYIRQRLKYIIPECFITDKLIQEIYKMLMEIYNEKEEKGKVMVKK